jgi:opacity protein-like surface antigen
MRLGSLLVFGALLLPASLLGQVGHDPNRSPYRTLRYGQFVGASVGYFNGSGGQIGLAPHDGMTVGLRYEFLSAGTITFGVGASYGRLDRFIVEPTKPIETALTGPIPQSMSMVEAILQFNLTGGKTWHRIAPFISGGFGLVLAGSSPRDTTDFKFRTKLAVTPGIGARIFLSDRMFLRLEARSTFWQISYPADFRVAPSSDPSKPPVIPGSGKEWVTNSWYSVGLSYAFHRPF